MATCRGCDARLSLHQAPPQLYCHHCGQVYPRPRICPSCERCEVLPLGQGTERLEQVVQQRFPDYPLVRIDRDSAGNKRQKEALLQRVHNQEARILIGTQMIAKGHHFSQLSLVAIIDADTGLFSADFRDRLFALLR